MPQLEEAFPLERRKLLARLPLVDGELVLDHLLRERLVPRLTAHPVLARADDVDAALGGRRARDGPARELFGQAGDLEAKLVRRPLVERLGHGPRVRLRPDAAFRLLVRD